MNKIVVNEKKYVLDALNGTEKPDIGFYSFLNLISKYYAAQCDTAEETIYNVDEQMKKLYKEEYLKEKWYVYISGIFKKVKEGITGINDREDVVVYTWDMCQVFKGETDQERKLLFSAYVIAHYMGCNGWLNTKTSKSIANWFEMANVACTGSDRFLLLGEMKKKGLIETTKKCDNLNIRVNMLSEYFGETPVFRITELENLGNLLIATYKDGYKQCKCGRLIKINSNRQTMCRFCASKIDQKKRGVEEISMKK